MRSALCNSAGQIVNFGIWLTAGQLSETNRIFEYLFAAARGAIKKIKMKIDWAD